MNSMAKKFLAGVMAGSLLLGAGNVYAAEKDQPHKMQIEMNLEDRAKEISNLYGVDEKEVLAALKDGKHFGDVEQAAMIAKISGKSFKKVLEMKSDWFDVMQKLGVTREQYREAEREMEVKNIAEHSDLDVATVKNLMDNHYHPRDIGIAGKLAKASGKDIQSVLDMKTLNRSWAEVAKELNVDKNLIRPHRPMDEPRDFDRE